MFAGRDAALALLLLLGCAPPRVTSRSPGHAPAAVAADAPPTDANAAVVPALPAGLRRIEVAQLPKAALWLVADGGGLGSLWLARDGAWARIECDPLPGAWALRIADVDHDGRAEAVVALRKPAKYDPTVDHRLHVYAFDGDRCVPLWRGTRLAGRFDAIDASGDDTLVVHERLSPTRERIATYRWRDFGYVLDAVLWAADEAATPPAGLVDGMTWAPAARGDADGRARAR